MSHPDLRQVLLDAIVQACKLDAEKEERITESQRQPIAPMRPDSAPPHVKCRSSIYPGYQRVPVSDMRLLFDVAWPEYDEVVKEFEAEELRENEGMWADPPLSSGRIGDDLLPKIQQRKTLIDTPPFGDRVEKALIAAVKFDPRSGAPLNPRGRTGLRGRGKLGRWGPNRAADGTQAGLDNSDALPPALLPVTLAGNLLSLQLS